MSETKELKKHSTEVWSLGCCFHRQFNALCYRAFGVWGGGLNTASVVGEIKSIYAVYCVRSERCDWPFSDMFRHVEGCIKGACE